VLLIIFLTSLVSLHGVHGAEEASIYIRSVFSTGGRISGSVLADPRGGFLAFSEDRYLYSFHNNGEFRSRKRVPGRPDPYHAQALDGVIYKYFDNNILKAINIRGNIIWSVRKNSPPAFAPVVNSMGNIITVTDNNIISYSYMGRKRWEAEVQGRFFSTPLAPASNGIVYAGISDGTVIAIDNHGQIVREVKISAAEITALGISNNRIFVSDRDSNLFVLDRQELRIINSVKLRSSALHIISNRSGRVIAALTQAGNVELFDSALSPFPVRIRGAGFTGNPLYFENSFYFVRDNGHIVKFDINRRRIEELPFPHEAVYGLRAAASNANRSVKISVHNNTIIIGGLDWNLYFIEERNYRRNQDAPRNYIFSRSSQNNIPNTGFLVSIDELSQHENLVNRERAFALLDEVHIDRITGNDERYILSILERVVFASGRTPSRASPVLNSVAIRTRTASVAAKIGTAETVNMLRTMLGTETSPVVASIIIEKLGKAGSDPFGETVRLFGAAYSRFPGDLTIFENILTGIKNINEYQGYFYEDEGMNLLFLMLDGTEERDLKLRIMDVMRTLEQ